MPEFFEKRCPDLWKRFAAEDYEKKNPTICEVWRHLYQYLDSHIEDKEMKKVFSEYIVEGYCMGKRMSDTLHRHKHQDHKHEAH
jgi:hypothetical protein